MINIYSGLVFRLVHICKIVLHLIEILACFFPHQLILFFFFSATTAAERAFERWFSSLDPGTLLG